MSPAQNRVRRIELARGAAARARGEGRDAMAEVQDRIAVRAEDAGVASQEA